MSAPLDLSHVWPSTQTVDLYWYFFSLESLIPYILDSSHPMPPPFIAPDEKTCHEYFLIGFCDLRLTQKCHFDFSWSGFWIASPFHKVSLTNHGRLSCQSSPLEANMASQPPFAACHPADWWTCCHSPIYCLWSGVSRVTLSFRGCVRPSLVYYCVPGVDWVWASPIVTSMWHGLYLSKINLAAPIKSYSQR